MPNEALAEGVGEEPLRLNVLLPAPGKQGSSINGLVGKAGQSEASHRSTPGVSVCKPLAGSYVRASLSTRVLLVYSNSLGSLF